MTELLPPADRDDAPPGPLLPTPAPSAPHRSERRRIRLGGCPIDLRSADEAMEQIRGRTVATTGRPLSVVSINLDHIHHFGEGRELNGAFGMRDGRLGDLEWLHLIDGMPIAVQARRVTGFDWPRLAGSDLVEPILAAAAQDGVSVGFLGGSPARHELLRRKLEAAHPTLRLGGCWAPGRGDLLDADTSIELADAIAEARIDVLFVCLGKPRQELWVDRFGTRTGAKVLLEFGAVVDFLGGEIRRAPDWVSANGMEWAWRLMLEPRRLARRYLVYGPGAYRAIRRAERT